MSQRLRLELAPSRAMAALILVSHAAAAGCAVLVLPNAMGIALAAGIGALGVSAAWGNALLRSPRSVRAIELDGTGGFIELAGGEKVAVEVGARRHVSRYSVTLPLLRPMRRTLFVAGDMLSADSFRLLRIWALWGRVPGVAGKQLPG